MTTSLKQIIPLSLALLTLLSYQFIGAQWSGAPATAPNSNVPAPVNVGAGDQVKTGGLSVETLAADDGIALSFLNTFTDPDTWTAWRVKRNDGTGNFVSYLNSEGGTAPTYETDGHAFREQFNPSDGHYRFQTSQAGTAGSAVTWENAMRILPGGKIGANEYCDINGNNCASAPLGGSGPSGSTVVPGWPDAIYCSIDTNVVLGGSSFNMAVLTLDDLSPGGDGYFYYKADSVNQVYNPDGSWNSGPQGDCYGLSIEELAAAGKAFSFGVTEFVPTLLDRKSFNTRGEVTAEFVSVSLAQGTDWCGLGMCPGAIHSNERGREEFCKMTLPGSVPLYYSDTAYHSPGNNSVALWDDGAGGWVYGNASNYNRLISTITCAK